MTFLKCLLAYSKYHMNFSLRLVRQILENFLEYAWKGQPGPFQLGAQKTISISLYCNMSEAHRA